MKSERILALASVVLCLDTFLAKGQATHVRDRVGQHKDNREDGASSPQTEPPPENLPGSEEKRLTKHLLRSYKHVGKDGRPVTNASQPITVNFGLAIIQMDLDERDNRLSTSVWCRYRWHDDFLKWNPSEFGDVHSIRLSSNKIWIPDIMLYNTADTQKMERDVLVVVSYDGVIRWIPHRIYHSSCKIDVTNYPFDSQFCQMLFGSWTYKATEINLDFYDDYQRLDTSELEQEITEWEILSKTESRHRQFYNCCAEPYVILKFSMKLRRKLVFSTFILTLPCISLAFLTLVVFCLPPDRPDRTSLAMSLFASFLLLLLILVEAAPPTASTVPMLGVYYCFNLLVIMLSIFLSSVVVNISRRGDTLTPVPSWLSVVCVQGLARLLCTSTDMHLQHARQLERRAQCRLCGARESPNSSHVIGNPHVVHNNVSPRDHDAITTVSQHAQQTIENHLMKIDRKLHRLQNSLQEVDSNNELRSLKLEWRLIAITLDRLFFAMFLVINIVSLIVLFPRPY